MDICISFVEMFVEFCFFLLSLLLVFEFEYDINVLWYLRLIVINLNKDIFCKCCNRLFVIFVFFKFR